MGGLGMAAPPLVPPPEEGAAAEAARSRGPELDPVAPTPPAPPSTGGTPAGGTPAVPATPPGPTEVAPAAAPVGPSPPLEASPSGPELGAIRPEAASPARTVTIRLIFPNGPQGVTLVDSAGARHRILPNTPVTLPLGELQILPHTGSGGTRVLITETSRILTCASADMCVVK